MKKLGYTLMMAISAVAFTACNTNTKDAKETADSLNEVKDTSGLSSGILVVEDDALFATKATNGNLAELEFGKLASERATNSELKSFAKTMVTEHQNSNEELKNLAMAKNITLPGAIDKDYQKDFDDLNTKKGKDFDKKYADFVIKEHQKTIDLMENQAKNGIDTELRDFASKSAPKLRSHLEKIKKIESSIK